MFVKIFKNIINSIFYNFEFELILKFVKYLKSQNIGLITFLHLLLLRHIHLLLQR